LTFLTQDFVADYLPADAEDPATETAFSAVVGFVTDFGFVTDLWDFGPDLTVLSLVVSPLKSPM
jgi:hypothetical protein